MDWKCDSCLFVNHFAVERCELCEDPKYRLLVLRKRRAMKPYEDRVDELIMVSNMLSEQTRTLAKLTVSNRSAFSAAYAATKVADNAYDLKILSAAVAAPSSGVAVLHDEAASQSSNDACYSPSSNVGMGERDVSWMCAAVARSSGVAVFHDVAASQSSYDARPGMKKTKMKKKKGGRTSSPRNDASQSSYDKIADDVRLGTTSLSSGCSSTQSGCSLQSSCDLVTTSSSVGAASRAGYPGNYCSEVASYNNTLATAATVHPVDPPLSPCRSPVDPPSDDARGSAPPHSDVLPEAPGDPQSDDAHLYVSNDTVDDAGSLEVGSLYVVVSANPDLDPSGHVTVVDSVNKGFVSTAGPASLEGPSRSFIMNPSPRNCLEAASSPNTRATAAPSLSLRNCSEVASYNNTLAAAATVHPVDPPLSPCRSPVDPPSDDARGSAPPHSDVLPEAPGDPQSDDAHLYVSNDTVDDAGSLEVGSLYVVVSANPDLDPSGHVTVVDSVNKGFVSTAGPASLEGQSILPKRCKLLLAYAFNIPRLPRKIDQCDPQKSCLPV